MVEDSMAGVLSRLQSLSLLLNTAFMAAVVESLGDCCSVVVGSGGGVAVVVGGEVTIEVGGLEGVVALMVLLVVEIVFLPAVREVLVEGGGLGVVEGVLLIEFMTLLPW